MLNRYKATPFRAPWFADSRRESKEGMLTAPFRLFAGAVTRTVKELASWVVTWRFLAGLDPGTTDFYRDVEGCGDPSPDA